MKYLAETGRGFFWALGASIVIFVMFGLYSLYVQAELEALYRENIRQIFDEKLSSKLEILAPEVIGFKVVDGRIVIASKAKNISINPIKAYLRFSLISDSDGGKYVSICNQPLVQEANNTGYVYYQTMCRPMYYPAGQINKVTVRLAYEGI